MGMEHRITFPSGSVPTWAALRTLFDATYPVQLRMINGELSFPDEQPSEPWQELRVGTPQGMVTLRREIDDVTCVTWGNAGPEQVEAWNAVTWVVAAAGAGTIATAAGPVTADQFRDGNRFPAGIPDRC